MQSSSSSSRSSATSPQFWSIDRSGRSAEAFSRGCQTRSLQQLMLNQDARLLHRCSNVAS
ncbi:hypothetical protein RS9916_30977 [Synechococcus sp. RS9916]|nr:hypothetical protein RS9916_30977 [Synechococcus sp. RS9916]